MMRSTFLAAVVLCAWVGGASPVPAADRPARPNVLLVMTDDQGYGDLACHGNPLLQTPALDRLHREGVRLTNFHVDPTCSPTRAALLTGRYSCRTGVWHTIMGRSILRRDETTVAQLFAQAGYRTGIFGKWHLGDNWPYRAMDRGFQQSLVHGGGGMGQTPDYWGNTYFSPTLLRNGQWTKTEGYCTDVFFTAAREFIRASRDRPFFCYVPTNVPHAPYQVPESYAARYREAGVPAGLAEFYGMITNFDENFGRLLQDLDDQGLAENTIVVFLTDNGTSGTGFNGQMRGRKGSAYEGGHRVPCFIRWPARLKEARDIPQLTAHIDLLPTLLDLCELPYPEQLRLDGRSLVPLLAGAEDWAPRTLFVQSHRIEHPLPWRQSAVMTEQYRLIDGQELYDLAEDPAQRHNVAGQHRDVLEELRRKYERWHEDVSARFNEYCAIPLGAAEQNPTLLTCHDWHGPQVPWDQSHILQRMPANGFWAVDVARAGRYRCTLRERPEAAKHPLRATAARLKFGEVEVQQAVPPGSTGVVLEADLPAGAGQLETWLVDPDGAARGAYFVEVEYLGPPAEPSPPAAAPAKEKAPVPQRRGRSAFD